MREFILGCWLYHKQRDNQDVVNWGDPEHVDEQKLRKQKVCVFQSPRKIWKSLIWERLLMHVCILVRVDSVLTAPQLFWEVLDTLFVHRWLWKAPLQWSKPSLSLASMAWACCLTISKRVELQHQALPRTALLCHEDKEEEKGLLPCLLYVGEIYSMCACNRFYNHFAFGWEVWRWPHVNRSNRNSFFSVTVLALPIPPPHFQTTHSTLIDGPLDPGLLQQPFNMFHRVVGDMANKDERTCDAGWPGELLSRCLWITE